MDRREILYKRYAKALFAVSEKTRNSARVREELQSLAGFLKEGYPELNSLISSAFIDRKQKKEIICSFCERAGICKVLRDFLCLLAEENRLDIIYGVFLKYRDIFEESRGYLKASVKTAHPLETSQKERLRQTLSAVFKKDVDIVTEVNPELLAGINIRVEDRVIDFSVRKHLESMRENLTTQGHLR